METSALTYTATSLSSAYTLAAQRPSSWARPELAFSHNQQLSQIEVYRAGQLAGFTRYTMRGADMWLLFTHLTQMSDSHTTDALIRDVLDDATRRRIAVHPYCTITREFMRANPGYIVLVPGAVRDRFRLNEPEPAVKHRTLVLSHGKEDH
ncbi:N-acetyltransferase [Arthrobacter sp. ERGS1:01]|uniref:N-acetyltransferase n=1 Tax=Arthrobacter sp. ERGS1:01 TaxID=1704044 RepID=UPI0012375836|nr:N-acetyltransferase [Arthrobacter sp. ERGS1:01]